MPFIPPTPPLSKNKHMPLKEYAVQQTETPSFEELNNKCANISI
jgi:hypothetical protein